MSTLPDFTGTGFFAGEAPDGLTTIAGTPTSASVRVYWRDPADPQAPDVLVASTQSAADGTWQIAGLNLALRYVVRAQKSQFDDVTVVGAMPARSDVIAYVDYLEPTEDFDGLTGHVLLDSGLPPFTCEVIQPLPYGLTARVDGRKLLIGGQSGDEGRWESVVRVTASNGVYADVPVRVVIFDGDAIVGGLPGGACLETYRAQFALHPLLDHDDVKWSISSGRLPFGLHLDTATGVIRGVANDAEGYYTVTVCASGSFGVFRKSLSMALGRYAMLLHFDGPAGSSDFIDQTGRVWSRVGPTPAIASEAKFGSGSLRLFGNSDFVQSNDRSGFDLGSDDWTIRGWIYHRQFTQPYPAILSRRNGVAFDYGLQGNATNSDYVFHANGASRAVVLRNAAINADTWRPFQVARKGNLLRTFSDGMLIEEVAFSGSITHSNVTTRIGDANFTDDGANCNLDEMSIIRGAGLDWDSGGYQGETPSDYPQPAPSLAISGSLPPATAGQAYTGGGVQVRGSGVITVSVTDGALPVGWSVAVSESSVTVAGPGAIAGGYYFVLTATDGVNSAALPLMLSVV